MGIEVGGGRGHTGLDSTGPFEANEGWKLNGVLRIGFAAPPPPLPLLGLPMGGEEDPGGPGANRGEAGGVP